MEADEKIGFELPKKPKIEQKEPLPDQRKFAVVPVRAINDKRIGNAAIRVLACLAGYANKAGITYVSQEKIASDLQVFQPQISRAINTLIQHGHLEVIGKPVSGKRGATVRVVFDENINAQDAVSIAQAGIEEDVRPPEWKEREQEEIEKTWTDEEIRENKKRLGQALKQAFSTKKPDPDAYIPKPTDSLAVRKFKNEARKNLRKMIYNAGHIQTQKDILYNSGVIQTQKPLYNTGVIQREQLKHNSEHIQDEMYNTGVIRTARMKFEDMLKCFNDNLFEQVKTNEDLKYLELLDQVGCVESDIVSACDRMRSGTVADVCKAIIKSKGM